MNELITTCPECGKELTEQEIILEACEGCGWAE
jgi:hypothetical protein